VTESRVIRFSRDFNLKINRYNLLSYLRAPLCSFVDEFKTFGSSNLHGAKTSLPPCLRRSPWLFSYLHVSAALRDTFLVPLNCVETSW